MKHELQDFEQNYCESSHAYYGLHYGLINSRRIHDSNIVSQEILHSIHRTMGKQGCFVMKIYLAKAYEKLNWSFLDKVIYEVRLPEKMKSIIMEAISSVQMTVL